MPEFRWEDIVNVNDAEARPFVTTVPRRPRPCFNLMSVLAPFVGILATIMFLGLTGDGGLWYWNLGSGDAWVAFFLGASCLAGLVTGLVATVRKEQMWGLTAVGMLLNAPVVMAFLVASVSALIGWLQYG